MSDVEIPVHVARMQVAAAIHLVIQIARFQEDGSRKVTRIAEVRGLNETGQFSVEDVFVSKLVGRDAGGRLQAELAFSGRRPTFSDAPKQEGIADRIRASKELWELG
ncbi:MAG: hypothetical protein GYA33_14265 [Thermogutta sp.]|nr:hypothetical protein [Thermogutta sp.]